MTNGRQPRMSTTDFPYPTLESQDTRRPPYWALLGIRILELAKGEATLELVIEEKHLRTLGFMHGGAMASIMDSCLGLAAWSAAPPTIRP